MGARLAARNRLATDIVWARSASFSRLADGDWFGDEPGVFRLGFGFPPPVELKAALDALRQAVDAAH